MTSLPRASLSKTILRAATIALACAILLAIFAAPSARAQTFTTLYRFTGGTDGGYPTAELIRDATGNLYSTTIDGGAIPCNGGGQFGCGTVFKLSPGNKETVLYAYTGDADGAYPYAGLVRDVDGILYACPISNGCGTVFQVDAAGKERVLYSFSGQADGATPYAGLVRDTAGQLYGSAVFGGDASGIYGHGVVFEVDATGKEAVLHTFGYPPDGSWPNGRLLLDSKGNIYGTTSAGGIVNNDCYSGCGTVFKLSPDGKGGWTETVLHKFAGRPDGANPRGALVPDVAGNLYGTTASGGRSSAHCGGFGPGCGTIFRVSPSGKTVVLYRFKSKPDGATPLAGLLLDSVNHVLYGTTKYGGTSDCTDGFGDGCGTVFGLNLMTGNQTRLHIFSGEKDGCYPVGSLIQDNAGRLYGTASFCATDGTVFRISP
jgi:uncharacterized repeat protein (TIGR03803 family)